MLPLMVGVVFIVSTTLGVLGSLARVTALRRNAWNSEDRSMLRVCLVASTLSGAAVLTYVMPN